jgi:hypothetical protein
MPKTPLVFEGLNFLRQFQNNAEWPLKTNLKGEHNEND